MATARDERLSRSRGVTAASSSVFSLISQAQCAAAPSAVSMRSGSGSLAAQSVAVQNGTRRPPCARLPGTLSSKTRGLDVHTHIYPHRSSSRSDVAVSSPSITSSLLPPLRDDGVRVRETGAPKDCSGLPSTRRPSSPNAPAPARSGAGEAARSARARRRAARVRSAQSPQSAKRHRGAAAPRRKPREGKRHQRGARKEGEPARRRVRVRARYGAGRGRDRCATPTARQSNVPRMRLASMCHPSFLKAWVTRERFDGRLRRPFAHADGARPTPPCAVVGGRPRTLVQPPQLARVHVHAAQLVTACRRAAAAWDASARLPKHSPTAAFPSTRKVVGAAERAALRSRSTLG